MPRHIPGGNRPDRVRASREAHNPTRPEPQLALSSLKKATLLAIAEEEGVHVTKSMTKAELVAAIGEA